VLGLGLLPLLLLLVLGLGLLLLLLGLGLMPLKLLPPLAVLPQVGLKKPARTAQFVQLPPDDPLQLTVYCPAGQLVHSVEVPGFSKEQPTL